jgi:hypothetical protein
MSSHSLGEPAFAAEAARGLGGACGEVEECPEADEESDGALEGEQPPPPLEAVHAVELEDGGGEERTDNGGGREGDPEPRQTDGELGGGCRVSATLGSRHAETHCSSS